MVFSMASEHTFYFLAFAEPTGKKEKKKVYRLT